MTIVKDKLSFKTKSHCVKQIPSYCKPPHFFRSKSADQWHYLACSIMPCWIHLSSLKALLDKRRHEKGEVVLAKKSRGDSDEYRNTDRPPSDYTFNCTVDDWVVIGWSKLPWQRWTTLNKNAACTLMFHITLGENKMSFLPPC